jgi:hypothetical protein
MVRLQARAKGTTMKLELPVLGTDPTYSPVEIGKRRHQVQLLCTRNTARR